MHFVSADDCRTIALVLAKISEPELAPPQCKKLLADGLAKLIDADTYIWSEAVVGAGLLNDAVSSSFVNGGWRDEEERGAFMRVVLNSKAACLINAYITGDGVIQSRTFLRQDVISDEAWQTLGAAVRGLGFAESMFSVVALSAKNFSCIGLYRRQGKPRFSDRERALAHIIFQSVDWMHRQGVRTEAGKSTVYLPPRQKEVLLLLMQGDSQKEIAKKLGISHHTVVDYMKGIYRRFDVSSRGELLAQFISGGA